MNLQQVPPHIKKSIISILLAILLNLNQSNFTLARTDLEEPDSSPAGSSDGGDGETNVNGANSGMYQPPEPLEVIRLSEKSIVLKWDIAHTSLDSLKFFKIQYKSTKKPDDSWKTDQRIIAPSTKAVQIDNLRPGNYMFIVSAVYDNDDNRPSEPLKFKLRSNSKILAQDLPDKKGPEITWSQAEVDQIRFKWSYNVKEKDISNGIFGYLVYYRSTYQVSDFLIYHTLDESVELAELEPETVYEAKVLYYNEHGVSDFSDILKIKTLSKSDSSQQITTLATISTNSPIAHTTIAPLSVNKSTHPILVSSPPPHVLDDSLPVEALTTTTTTTSTTTTTVAPLLTQTSSPPRNTIKVSIYTPDFSLTNMLSWNDTPVIRYSLGVIVLILFVLCLMVNCVQRKKNTNPPASQEDLEFNGFFKNSFPASPTRNPPNYCLSYGETA